MKRFNNVTENIEDGRHQHCVVASDLPMPYSWKVNDYTVGGPNLVGSWSLPPKTFSRRLPRLYPSCPGLFGCAHLNFDVCQHHLMTIRCSRIAHIPCSNTNAAGMEHFILANGSLSTVKHNSYCMSFGSLAGLTSAYEACIRSACTDARVLSQERQCDDCTCSAKPGEPVVFTDAVLNAIASKYNKTASQVSLISSTNTF